MINNISTYYVIIYVRLCVFLAAFLHISYTFLCAFVFLFAYVFMYDLHVFVCVCTRMCVFEMYLYIRVNVLAYLCVRFYMRLYTCMWFNGVCVRFHMRLYTFMCFNGVCVRFHVSNIQYIPKSCISWIADIILIKSNNKLWSGCVSELSRK